MKIAILTTGNLSDMKGIMNYVHEKALRFKSNPDIMSSCFFILTQYVGILKLLYHKADSLHDINDGDIIHQDGVDYHIIIRRCGFLEAIKNVFLNNFVSKQFAKVVSERLQDYDVITAHQLPCTYTAMLVKELTGKPFLATWHGSDINVSPRSSRRVFRATKKVIESADKNYFVSKGLMKASSYITEKGVKEHIYTGPSSHFYRYSLQKRCQLKSEYNVENSRVIIYCGNLIPIKNVLILPEIYQKLKNKMQDENLVFWIVGNGAQSNILESKLKNIGCEYRMFGKVPPSEIPD